MPKNSDFLTNRRSFRKSLPWWIFILTLLLASVGIYGLIPSQLDLSSAVITRCNDKSASRFLSRTSSWTACCPGYNGRIRRTLPFILEVPWTFQDEPLSTTLVLVPGSQDSIGLQWKCTMATGLNPLHRWQRYRQALALKAEMKQALGCLGEKLADEKNLYSVPIQQIISPDSNLVAIRKTMDHLPGTPDTYALVHRLKAYLDAHNALQTDHPMQHVTTLGNGKFEIMVALPTNKSLAGSGDIFYRRFVPWHTIIATATGGEYSIADATRQMQLYLDDHHRVSMAMPFQSLVTDRSLETDTGKWVTNICQPVF